MALLPGTLGWAGPLSSDVLDLQVAEHGPHARVVTVVGEVDALTAPELAAFVTAQLVVAQVVVVNLDGVRFMSSAGLRALFEANEFAIREGHDLRLVCNSQTANWALETTGLREHFTFTDNVPRSAPAHGRSGRTPLHTRRSHRHQEQSAADRVLIRNEGRRPGRGGHWWVSQTTSAKRGDRRGFELLQGSNNGAQYGA